VFDISVKVGPSLYGKNLRWRLDKGVLHHQKTLLFRCMLITIITCFPLTCFHLQDPSLGKRLETPDMETIKVLRYVLTERTFNIRQSTPSDVEKKINLNIQIWHSTGNGTHHFVKHSLMYDVRRNAIYE